MSAVSEHRPAPAAGPSAWLEIARPFSWTASIVPVLVGTAVAFYEGGASFGLFLLALVGSVLLQAGTNIINEVFDVRRGVDTLETPRASRAIIEGRLDMRHAYLGGIFCFLAAMAIGAVFAWALHLGTVPFWLGALGALAGYFYTAPPLEYKYRALGTPLVFLLMGPLMVLGAEFVQRGVFSTAAIWASLPVGCLVASILHANELRDAADDTVAGVMTLPVVLGRRPAFALYDVLLFGGYVAVLAGVLLRALPAPALAILLSLPLALRCSGRLRGDLSRIDQETAKLHLLSGALLALGLAAAALL